MKSWFTFGDVGLRSFHLKYLVIVVFLIILMSLSICRLVFEFGGDLYNWDEFRFDKLSTEILQVKVEFTDNYRITNVPLSGSFSALVRRQHVHIRVIDELKHIWKASFCGDVLFYVDVSDADRCIITHGPSTIPFTHGGESVGRYKLRFWLPIAIRHCEILGRYVQVIGEMTNSFVTVKSIVREGFSAFEPFQFHPHGSLDSRQPEWWCHFLSSIKEEYESMKRERRAKCAGLNHEYCALVSSRVAHWSSAEETWEKFLVSWAYLWVRMSIAPKNAGVVGLPFVIGGGYLAQWERKQPWEVCGSVRGSKGYLKGGLKENWGVLSHWDASSVERAEGVEGMKWPRMESLSGLESVQHGKGRQSKEEKMLSMKHGVETQYLNHLIPNLKVCEATGRYLLVDWKDFNVEKWVDGAGETRTSGWVPCLNYLNFAQNRVSDGLTIVLKNVPLVSSFELLGLDGSMSLFLKNKELERIEKIPEESPDDNEKSEEDKKKEQEEEKKFNSQNIHVPGILFGYFVQDEFSSNGLGVSLKFYSPFISPLEDGTYHFREAFSIQTVNAALKSRATPDKSDSRPQVDPPAENEQKGKLFSLTTATSTLSHQSRVPSVDSCDVSVDSLNVGNYQLTGGGGNTLVMTDKNSIGLAFVLCKHFGTSLITVHRPRLGACGALNLNSFAYGADEFAKIASATISERESELRRKQTTENEKQGLSTFDDSALDSISVDFTVSGGSLKVRKAHETLLVDDVTQLDRGTNWLSSSFSFFPAVELAFNNHEELLNTKKSFCEMAKEPISVSTPIEKNSFNRAVVALLFTDCVSTRPLEEGKQGVFITAGSQKKTNTNNASSPLGEMAFLRESSQIVECLWQLGDLERKEWGLPKTESIRYPLIQKKWTAEDEEDGQEGEELSVETDEQMKARKSLWRSIHDSDAERNRVGGVKVEKWGAWEMDAGAKCGWGADLLLGRIGEILRKRNFKQFPYPFASSDAAAASQEDALQASGSEIEDKDFLMKELYIIDPFANFSPLVVQKKLDEVEVDPNLVDKVSGNVVEHLTNYEEFSICYQSYKS